MWYILYDLQVKFNMMYQIHKAFETNLKGMLKKVLDGVQFQK